MDVGELHGIRKADDLGLGRGEHGYVHVRVTARAARAGAPGESRRLRSLQELDATFGRDQSRFLSGGDVVVVKGEGLGQAQVTIKVSIGTGR